MTSLIIYFDLLLLAKQYFRIDQPANMSLMVQMRKGGVGASWSVGIEVH